MTADHLGPWEPLPVTIAKKLFERATFRWWLAGGHSLATHLSRNGPAQSWRLHDDTDIGICRQDAPRLFDLLPGWDIHVAADGVLTPWRGDPLGPEGSDRAGNNLWCRPSATAPWALDILIGDGDEQHWIYRRDRTVRRPWEETVLLTADGLPYLAPEVQLLFKSRTIRPKDTLDANAVIPQLEPKQSAWLARHLSPGHPWLASIDRR